MPDDKSTVLHGTLWVEAVPLPTNRRKSENKFACLDRNFRYIKHMMSELGLQQNSDYIIIRAPFQNQAQPDCITVMLAEHSRSYASLIVLIWGKYEHAKTENNL